MNLADISKLGIKNPFKERYDNFIGGKFVPPVKGQYFENISPVIGKTFCEVARSTAEDVELALPGALPARRQLRGVLDVHRQQRGLVQPQTMRPDDEDLSDQG